MSIEPDAPVRNPALWAALQHSALCEWSHHRAAVRAWLVAHHGTRVGVDPRESLRPCARGHGPGPGDVGRVGALMTGLGVDLDTDLGRKLTCWAMANGAGARDPKLHALVERLRWWMRRLGMLGVQTDEYAIRSYENGHEGLPGGKYAIRIKNPLTESAPTGED